MSILLLTSTCGAPGVTTLAVGLALTWPRPVLLADCDPGAHQSILAGYLAGASAGGKGLLRVAEAHRDRRSLREVVIDQSIPLSDHEGTSRRFLPGFTKAGSAAHFGAIWPDLSEAFERLSEVEIDVIVDCGRISQPGLPAALVERSAMTTVVLNSSLRSVMSARVHLPALRDHGRLGADARRRLGLVVVGEGQPYGSAEIAKALNATVIGTVADDRQSAAHLSDGRTRHRRFDTSALMRSVADLGARLATDLQRSAELVRS